jgi:hypothetical protein
MMYSRAKRDEALPCRCYLTKEHEGCKRNRSVERYRKRPLTTYQGHKARVVLSSDVWPWAVADGDSLRGGAEGDDDVEE